MCTINISDIFVYVFEAFLFWFYCESLFKSRIKKVFTCSIIIGAYALLYLVFQLRINYLNALCNMIVIFLVIKILYNETVIYSIIHTFIFYAFLIGSEYVVMPVLAIILKTDFNSYMNIEIFYILAAVISKILHLVCCVIFIVIYQRVKNQDKRQGLAITLTIPVANTVVLVLIQYAIKDTPINKGMYTVWTVSAILILFSSFLVFYNRSSLIRQSEKISELTIENQKRKLDEQYLSVLEKSNDDMQILAHDFKNHLIYVRNLENVEDIDSYIDKIYPDIEKFQRTGTSQNKTLEVILSKYTSICELKNIQFLTDIKNANLSQVESVDLIALTNNLLDNAVESAEKSADKKIIFTLTRSSSFMDKLTIQNSCDEPPKQSAGKLISYKIIGTFHGTGLKSVKKVCEQYGANYAWNYDSEQHLFTTTVLMPREQA